ncbi:MAG: hypothetical protein KAJ54_00215, partial [Candidatus Aenigmarchaeota archaeon]|nr:hypothetical protein [Candidatus Aenigmarchaeota archaeon]
MNNGTVRIVNCSDNSILSSSDFSGDALSVPWNAGWTNYMVNFTGMGDYIDRSFRNGSVCFSNEYDSVFYIYPVNTTSINVTVIDEISGRPIPGAYVNLTRTNVDVEADQGNNFRCDNGVCRTDSSGNMILIVKSCGTFNLSVNASEYVNYSQMLPTITLGGEIYYGDDYQKSFTMRAATVISGYLLDEYNAERISSATVSLMLHEWNSSAEHSGNYLGYDGMYNYTVTSNGDGSYAIYVPASLISSEYDLMLEHEDYIKTYKYEGSKGAGGGYGGGYTNLNLTMKGLLPVNGTVLDCFNDYGVSGVEIFIQNTLTDSNYTTITDSDGDFSLYLRNSIGGYDDYNITLDKSSYNIGQMSNLSVYINTCISGSFIVNGTVEDKYKTTVSGRVISGGLVFVDVAGTIQDYNITSDGSGYFSINIPKGVGYDLRVSKTGFITRNYYGESAASGNYKDYGVVNLTGSNSISGTVVDHSGEYRTSGAQIEDAVIEIYQFSGIGNVLYKTVSDANGAYSVSVPSDLDYLIRFSALNYNPVSYQILADNDPSPSISLYGTTFYEGYVLDTNMDSDKVITPGTMMEFFEGDTKVYSIDMSSRKFEMYMGISDFNVTLSHQGYITNTVEDESSGGNWSKNYTLSGRAYLSFNAYDNFSSGNLSGAVMRLFDESGNIIYKTIGTDEYGDEVFNVDSTRSYSLSAVRAGYQPRFFTGGSAVSSSSYYNCSTEAPNCTMFNDTSVVTTNTDDQSYADIFVDYNDNKWVVWQDNRGGNWNIYYTRLDVDGSVVIAQKALTTVTSHQTKPRVFGSGNYIWVFWEDDRASKKDIYASMMHRNGTVIRSNVAVVNTTYSQSEPYAVVDAESGSMWLYWIDDSLGDYNLYTKNLLFNMSSLTSPVSIASVDALGISTYSVTEDVLGNSWIFYVDNATGSDDLYYLKYDENHTLIVSGEKLSDNSSEKIYPSVSSDGNGDIWVTWADNREDVLFDIYFSKVYQNRSISIYDTQVVGNPSSQQLSSVEISGERTYITWVDGRSGSDNIYLSVLDNGGSVYNSGEILTHSVSGDNILPRSTVTSDGVMYVLFYGYAAGNKDVYLSNITRICSDPVVNAVCFDKDVTLSAVFEVNVRDPVASGEYQNVWNALVQVYHNYNETLRPVSISPTIVNVDVTCGGSTYAGINVSALNNDNALEFVTQSDGVAVVSGIPIGLYNITVNGSEIGCGAATIEINIRDAGLNHSLSFSVSQTNLYVQALDPLGQPIYPANVSYQNSDLVVESMTPDAGQFAYYDTNVPNGVYNVYVNNSPYYNQNDTTCTVSAEGGSNMCVVYLEPNPGNLSVHVLNATGDMANINITVDNSSIPVYSGETNGTGWYLFSDLAGLFNVTVDGEQYGFENGTSANLLVDPLGETVVEYTLDVTRLDIIVTNTTGQVLDTANVTLFVVGSGSTATNYTGDAMSEITGSDGTVSFVRLIAGVYNLSIDVTGYGHYINSSFKVEGGTNEFDLSMQKTAMNVTVKDTLGNIVSGVNVTVKDENGLTYYEGISGSDGEVMFNSTIHSIGYNITADGTLIGYNYTSMNETIVGGILNNITIIIEENRLNVTLYSEHDGLVLKNVAVSVNTTPSTVVYTDENGAAVFGLLDPGLYNVTVNSGVIAGVNYTDFEVSVSGITSSEVVMRENVLRICVINDLSEPVIDGVNVSVYSNESPFVLLDDSFGAPMRNVTSTSLFGAGNITYRQVPLNHSGGPVVNSTVNITVNGSLMGYGSNVSYMADLVRDYNEVYILINRTLLVVNVTDQAGNPVDSIINLYNLSDLNNPVINSTGDVMSCDSGASGLCTFTGLISGQYNVTAINEKTVDNIDDFSVILITEGTESYLHLDPPMVLPFLLGTYYNGVIGNDVVFTFNVTYGGSVVENVIVELYMPEQEYAGTYLYTSELSDSGGLAVFTLTPGVYDVKVDGSQEGYGIVRIDSLKVGKLLVSQGYTDNQGDVVLPIDGRSISGTSSNGFNVNVFAYGYQEYDTYGIISGDLVGSYYSHGVYDTAVYGSLPNLNNDAYSITLTGNMTFTGRISDAYAIIAQAYAKYLAADITIYSASENERYEFSSASDGYYSVDMSNYAWGATSSGSKVQPLMSVEKSGYVTDSGTLSVSYHDNPLVDVELVGNSSITGYVYGYNTTEPASQINVSFKDNLGNKVYSVLSDNNGSFNFYANPNYAPYTLHFRDATYYNLLAYETTPFVEYDSANNEDIYYM